jgi:D-serine deaminase-like pyridoxal phosphate-dependent protein
MPRLLLDKEKCLRNIEKMWDKASLNQLSFRPHCKTHQSAEIASWYRDFGVNAITVSSFRMARYFAEAGWKDILVAFPFHPGEMEALIALSGKCRLSILVDSPATLPFLHHLPHRVEFYIDIDTGYGRTGVRSENPELIEQILVKASNNSQLVFQGFYCHAGHSYNAASRKESEQIHLKALSDLNKLKTEFGQYKPRLLFGDTPNCSMQENFRSIDEITPGNFVFYDLVQVALGACSLEEIAVAMECPVAGRYPAGKRVVIHGGAVHFSKESLLQNGVPVYGQLVQQTEQGWTMGPDNIFLSNISQEHGVVERSGELVSTINIGEKLLFLPVHSCLTANLMREYSTLKGERISSINA